MKIAILAIGLSIIMLAFRASVLPEIPLLLALAPVLVPTVAGIVATIVVLMVTWKIDRDNRSHR